MDAREVYGLLLQRFRERSLLLSSKAVLEWDEETNLPARAIEHRGAQIAQLAGLAYEMLLDPWVGEALARLAESAIAADPLSPEAVNLREWRRLRQRHERLERALVEEIARRTSVAQRAWAEARERDDFSSFAPHLERVLEVKRLEARALAPDAPYDALLDEFAPGMTAERLRALFDPLAGELRRLLDRIRGSRRAPRTELLRRRVPAAAQLRIAGRVAAALGYDFDGGRIDTSAHPFTAQLGPHDVRVTTRFVETDFAEGLTGILHEAGHALYDQGLPAEHFGTPRGEPVSSALHESQSRLWENCVGRQLATWRWLLPLLRDEAPAAFDGVEVEPLHFAVCAVRPGANRVRADEVTYNLHVFVRFELERALLSGDLAVKDLPGAWNEAYARELGVRPARDADGCLQDGHWGAGMIGYFPTYALGNLIAAQLFAAAARELGALDAAFARGEFHALRGWLARSVYAHGHALPADELLRHATGRPLDPSAFLEGLSARYGALYALAPA